MRPAIFFVLACLLSIISRVSGNEVSHPCKRTCPYDGSTMTCYYDFTIEWFTTISAECGDCPFDLPSCYKPGCNTADGISRPIIVINRQTPGPPIEVCENDTIVVKVRNRMESGEGVTLHWHGLYQLDTPYMDGVPMVTQCPITQMTDFTYRFKAWPSGTHFYHGHVGTQRSDGLFGALIIRQNSQNDMNWHDYDEDRTDHIIIVNDWVHEATISKFTHHIYDQGSQSPASILVNGKGSSAKYLSNAGETILTPKSVFNVSPFVRYRFRLIDAGFLTCPVVLSISNHTFRVVSTDSYPVEPTAPLTTLILHAGEMYDIVVETDQPVGNYWINFKGLQECADRKTFGQAILRYRGAANEEPTEILSYDDLDSGPLTTDFTQYKSLLANDETSKANADVQFYIALDMDRMDMHGMMGMGGGDMDRGKMGMDHGNMGMDHGNMDMDGMGMDDDSMDVGMDDHGGRMGHEGHMGHHSMSDETLPGKGHSSTMEEVITGGTGLMSANPTKEPHAGHMMNMHMSRKDSMSNMTMPYGDPLMHSKVHKLYTERTGPRSHHVHHPHINLIQYRPTSSPLLTQFEDVNQTAFCNSSSKPAECPQDPDTMETCTCTHLLKVPLGAVVELIMFDQGVMKDFEHSMHLHGNGFRVVASERLAKRIKAVDVTSKTDFVRNLDHAVKKDAVYVPEGGYTIIRFHATNPGFWIFHCHIQFHSDSGMALVFQVGERSEMKKAPPRFPTCGSYDPIDFMNDGDDDVKSVRRTVEADEDLNLPNAALQVPSLSLVLYIQTILIAVLYRCIDNCA